MTSSKTRGVRRLIQDRYGIDDNQLAFEIVQYVMSPEPGSAVVNGGKFGHPAILLAKRLTGKAIPSAMVDEIITVLGDKPDEERAKKCHAQMVRRGYEGAWYWLDDYAGTSKKPQAQPFQPTAVYEWRE